MKYAAILLVLCAATVAQESNGARDAKLIASAKQVSVQKLDESLPDVSFRAWLEKESGADAKFRWETNDCGEQTGSPDGKRPIPACVEVDSTLKDNREIVIFIADDNAETATKDAVPNWKIFFAQLSTPHEKINLRRLSDLPAALIKTQNHPETAK